MAHWSGSGFNAGSRSSRIDKLGVLKKRDRDWGCYRKRILSGSEPCCGCCECGKAVNGLTPARTCRQTLPFPLVSCPSTSFSRQIMSSSSFPDAPRSRPIHCMPTRLLSSLKRPFSRSKSETNTSILVCRPLLSPLSHLFSDFHMRAPFSPIGPANLARGQPHRATNRLRWACTYRVPPTFQLTSRTCTHLPRSHGFSGACHHPRPPRRAARTRGAQTRRTCTPPIPLPVLTHPLPPHHVHPHARIHVSHHRRRARH